LDAAGRRQLDHTKIRISRPHVGSAALGILDQPTRHGLRSQLCDPLQLLTRARDRNGKRCLPTARFGCRHNRKVATMFASAIAIAGARPATPTDTPLAAVLARLAADATAVLDLDRDAARVLLGRMITLLQIDQDRGLQAAGPLDMGVLARWQAQRVTRHIEANLARSLQLQELSEIAGLSCSYFSRAFKASFGEAPHAFIIRRRIERAQHEMLLSDEPLAQIALVCGFADQAHLSRVFRRLVGSPPNAWRRERRGARFQRPLPALAYAA